MIFLKFRGKTPTGEWAQKHIAHTNFLKNGHKMDFLFLGDSTVSGGIRPKFINTNAFNFARNGADPSEILPISKEVIKGNPNPKIIYLSITPGYASQNLWKNPTEVPMFSNLTDGVRLFFKDTNSLQSFFLFGGHLTNLTMESLIFRITHRVFRSGNISERYNSRFVDVDGAFLPDMEGKPSEIAKIPLQYRRSNFMMLRQFKDHWSKQGVRVVWIYLPYRSDYQQFLEHEENYFYTNYCNEIQTIFGNDVIDLRRKASDKLFIDQVHLNLDGGTIISKLLHEN